MSEFLPTTRRLGIEMTEVRQSEPYRSGRYNAAIRRTMERQGLVFDTLAEQQTIGRDARPIEERRQYFRRWGLASAASLCGRSTGPRAGSTRVLLRAIGEDHHAPTASATVARLLLRGQVVNHADAILTAARATPSWSEPAGTRVGWTSAGRRAERRAAGRRRIHRRHGASAWPAPAGHHDGDRVLHGGVARSPTVDGCAAGLGRERPLDCERPHSARR
jgi:hypothetical protein